MKPKKRKQRGRRRRSHATFLAKFEVGNRVRVKPGMTDPDYEDIPLGGWAGTISEVDRRSNPPTYLINWDQRTLDHMHPIYRFRCERDGLDHERAWLEETDLELDSGEPVAIEQPMQIVARPLSKDNLEDRIRAIFALTSDDPLPPVNLESLQRYARYLTTKLSFPFQANHLVATRSLLVREYPVTVVGLLDAEDYDEDDGVLCEVEQGGRSDEVPLISLVVYRNWQQRQLIGDYSYWFYNRSGDDELSFSPERSTDLTSIPPQKRSLVKLILQCGMGAALCGMDLGSLLATSENAAIGALVGAVILGVIGLLLGKKTGPIPDEAIYLQGGRIFPQFMAALAGCLFGSLLGAMLFAFVGTLSGGIVGWLIWWLSGKVRLQVVGPVAGIFLGASVGAVASACYSDTEKALTGALVGAGIAAILGPLLLLALTGILVLLLNPKQDLKQDNPEIPKS
jgi:hypothetical protein